MATTQPTVENRTARIGPQHKNLGIDAEGYVHHLDWETRKVHRIAPDGARERVSRLNEPAGNSMETYVHDFVGGQIGWFERTLTSRDFFGGAE